LVVLSENIHCVLGINVNVLRLHVMLSYYQDRLSGVVIGREPCPCLPSL